MSICLVQLCIHCFRCWGHIKERFCHMQPCVLVEWKQIFKIIIIWYIYEKCVRVVETNNAENCTYKRLSRAGWGCGASMLWWSEQRLIRGGDQWYPWWDYFRSEPGAYLEVFWRGCQHPARIVPPTFEGQPGERGN